MLIFDQGEADCGIAVVNGVATLLSDVRNSAYKESYFDFGPNNTTPVVNDSQYTFALDAIFEFAAEELTITLGQPLTEVGSYVAVTPQFYWRPAGTSKILCDSDGKIIICTWGREKTRQQVIDNDGDFGSIELTNGQTQYFACETWFDASYYSQRSQLLSDYDFIICQQSEYNGGGNCTILFPDGSMIMVLQIGSDVSHIPDSFTDYVAP